MKKLAAVLVAVSSLALATPVFACPNMDKDDQKTADQTKKADDQKTADKAKDSKATEKAADKTKDPKATQKPAAKG